MILKFEINLFKFIQILIIFLKNMESSETCHSNWDVCEWKGKYDIDYIAQ